MHPKDLPIIEFDYDLPDEKIARYPVEKRDSSKLLIYRNNTISEDIFSNLAEHLPVQSLLVFNNTKVVKARLLFEKANSIIEIFCLEPPDKYPDPTTALLRTSSVVWKCLVGNAKKWKDEVLSKRFYVGEKDVHLSARKIGKLNDIFLVEFSWNDDSINFAEILHAAGVTPLPPYLHRQAEEQDAQNYQTVYAAEPGSVAAPTAGLHFTKELFEKLKAQKIVPGFITLHVGAGTFIPVKSQTIRQHEMHAEYFEVSKEFIEQLIDNIHGNIIVVGTTTLRTLESLYWMGVKLIQILNERNRSNILTDDICINQWEAYELPAQISAGEALQAMLLWMNENKLKMIIAKTRIIIVPPYKLKMVKALITNFHQPKSTLLLLVATVIGDDWKKVYEYALDSNFRFLSYGDGCLFYPS